MNGMKCLHQSIECEPNTEVDSCVRIKTKVDNGEERRVPASTSNIEPVDSAVSRSDPVMNMTASITDKNERTIVAYACTWKSQEQVKLLGNDNSGISHSSLPE